MPVYGFDSQSDFNRAVKSIKASENARMDVTAKRGRYPIGTGGGGGGTVKPYIVTEMPDGQALHYQGIAWAKPLTNDTTDAEPTDADVAVAITPLNTASVMKGVVIWGVRAPKAVTLLTQVAEILIDEDVTVAMVSGGIGSRIVAECVAAIDADAVGAVTVSFTDVFGYTQTATFSAINLTGRGLDTEQRVIVDLMTEVMPLSDPTTRYAVTAVLECA